MSGVPVWFVARETPTLYLYSTAESPSASEQEHRKKKKTKTKENQQHKCRLVYLDEGGANFVFKILPDENENETGNENDEALLPRLLQRKLLRLGKDLSHVQTAEEQLKALDVNFTTLFPAEHLIEHELIVLHHDLTTSLNAMLEAWIRPHHRLPHLLPNRAMSGMLVTDMTPAAGEVLLELKPKWLAPSPNAPPNAKRCRTCAVRAHRASERICTATDAQASCPLDLINPDPGHRRRCVHAITTDPQIRDYLLTQAQPLLQQLRTCQAEFDRVGVLNISGNHHASSSASSSSSSSSSSLLSLCKAMTLRDCTLFVKRSGDVIDARLGDLDLKHPEKISRWKKVEANLISGGWYTNSESPEHYHREKICMLAR